MFIDAHCHVDSIRGYARSETVLPVATGHTHGANVKTVDIAKKLKIPFVLGISPQAAQRQGIAELEEWTQFIKGSKPCAIGEIGLDYHWAETEEDKENQRIAFERMLELAEEMHLPIVIHARKAIKEVYDTLRKKSFKNGFMMHFFSGTDEEAREAIGLGGHISIIALRSKERRKVINATPLEYLMAETDAPAIGRTPEEVVRAIEYIREVKNIDFELAAKATAQNARRFFNIEE